MISLQYIFYLSLALNLIFIIIYLNCPYALRLAIAKIRGQYLILKWSKQAKLIPEPAWKEGEFLASKSGNYETEPEDMFSFNGCRSALFYESYNRSINPEALQYITLLKRKYGLNTKNELQVFLSVPREKLVADGREDLALIQDKIKNDESFILDDIAVIRPRDLYGYMKARNPFAVKSEIERKVHIERMKLKNALQDYMKYIIPIVVLMVGAVLAFKMLGNGDAGGASSVGSGTAAALGVK